MNIKKGILDFILMLSILTNLLSKGQEMLTLSRSQAAFEQAQQVMPGGVNSPVRAARGLGIDPLVLKSAIGCTLKDLDDQTYTDFCMSWGAIILGHADCRINAAIASQAALGTSYGVLSELEILLAQRLTHTLPHLEKLRFVSSGTEATMSALRLARGYTGRSKIVKFSGHYHGHHDALLKNAGSFLSNTSASLGVNSGFIEDTLVIAHNDPASFALLPKGEIAAIIMEPVCGNMGVVLPKPEFLEALHSFCEQEGALFIVDEVITGFRHSFQGATADFMLKGDLYCYGKIIGGGLPCALFGGRKEIMDYMAPLGGVFQAGTLSGNPLAMAAGLAVTEALLEPSVYEKLNAKADLLLDPIEALIKETNFPITLNRYGSMFSLFFGLKKVEKFEDLTVLDQGAFKRFYQALYARGIYFSPSPFESNFISLAHSDERLSEVSEIICQLIGSSSSCILSC